MQVDVLREKLYRACLLAGKVITTKSNLPILSNIAFITNENGELLIIASDLEVSVRLSLKAKIIKQGKVTVPARKFIEYLASLNSEKVSLEVSQKQIEVISGDTKARFVTMPMDEFPVLPESISLEKKIIIPRDLFRESVRQVVFAAARNDAHPVLSGVLFEFEGSNRMKLVSTDSFRLSYRQMQVETNVKDSVIIPARALTEIDQFISEASNFTDDVPNEVLLSLSEGDNQLFFKYANIEVITRLLEAEFPNYKRVIPEEFNTQVSVNRVEFIQAIKRTSIFAAREGQAIKLEFSPSKGNIISSAQSVEVGSHSSVIHADVSGENMILGFNSKFILEGLESFKDEIIHLEIKDNTAPVRLTSSESPDYIHIVMPMSLTSEG